MRLCKQHAMQLGLRKANPGNLATLPVNASALSAIECDEQYALRIKFGNMGYICVPQDQDDFETFTIAVPGKMMIIG